MSKFAARVGIAIVIAAIVGGYAFVLARTNSSQGPPIAIALPTPRPTLPPSPTPEPTSMPRGSVDSPAAEAELFGTLHARGWAIDVISQTGTGVDDVELYLDGQPVAAAEYGQARDDVGEQYGPQFRASGWAATLDLSQVALGPHTLEAVARSTFDGRTTTYAQDIVVVRSPSVPRGAIDAPAEGATTQGTLATAGWAIDAADQSNGPGVDRVEILIDGTPAASAAIGVARPDVASGYGEPFRDAGWEADVDLSRLQPGSHTLEAAAHSAYSNQVTSYRRTFVVAGT